MVTSGSTDGGQGEGPTRRKMRIVPESGSKPARSDDGSGARKLPPPGGGDGWCCGMRRRYLLSIVAENPEAPLPPDRVDFIDWSLQRPDRKPVMRIKFCPFCGLPQSWDAPVRWPKEPGPPGDPQ